MKNSHEACELRPRNDTVESQLTWRLESKVSITERRQNLQSQKSRLSAVGRHLLGDSLLSLAH